MSNITPFNQMSREQLKAQLGMSAPKPKMPNYILRRNHTIDESLPAKDIITIKNDEVISLGQKVSFVPIMLTKRLAAPQDDRLMNNSISGLYTSEFVYSNEPILSFQFVDGEKIQREYSNSYDLKAIYPELKTEGLLYLWVPQLKEIKRFSIKGSSWQPFIEFQNQIDTMGCIWPEVVGEMTFEKVSSEKTEKDGSKKNFEFFQLKMEVTSQKPPKDSLEKFLSSAQELTKLIRDGNFYEFAQGGPIVLDFEQAPAAKEDKKASVAAPDAPDLLPDDLDEIFNAE